MLKLGVRERKQKALEEEIRKFDVREEKEKAYEYSFDW